MASAFNLLTAGGARFDKSRFQKDINLFTGAKQPIGKKDKGKQRATDASALPSSLNLFHTAQPKAAHEEDKDEGSDAESSASGSSASSSSQANVPEPPKQKITITGADPLPKSLHANLPSLVSHETSSLTSAAGQPLLTALRQANIHSLWGVQCAVAGCLLGGKDTMCVAPTGSGKTLSYVLPTLVRLSDPARSLKDKADEERGRGIRALFVVPTHDLAVQIEGVVKAVTRGRAWRVMVLTKATQKAVCDSAPGDDHDGESDQDSEEDEEKDDKTGASRLGLDVLIATPERLHHLLEEKKLSLAETRQLVLDESDRLLSPDFLPQVEPIIDACTHKDVQKCFLSATMPAGSETIAKKWLRDGGVRVVVGLKDSAVSTIDQSLLYTGSESGKLMALRNMIASGQLPYPSLIFTQSIERADELHQALALEGMRVDVVHGNRGKQKRDEAIKEFREGKVWCLVVTEVLARGMDFRGVKLVVNYDFPQTVQSYIHRIGRTGRAGRPGKAITFFSTEDGPYLRTIANVLRASGCDVPEYMLNMPKPSKNKKRNLAKAPPKRKQVGGGGRDVGKEQGRKKRQMIDASRRKQGGPAEVSLAEDA